jgi:hypothetical protein
VAAPAITTAEEPKQDNLPAVIDPVGRSETVDGRLLTEAMFFRFGYEQMGYEEIGEALSASVLWVGGVLGRHEWLNAARERGLRARAEALVVDAERAITRQVNGYALSQQKVTKDGDVVDYEVSVGPSEKQVGMVLEKLAPERWGAGAGAGRRTLSVRVVAGVNERLAAAGMEVIVQDSDGGAE